MKELFIVRHGKSSWDIENISDIDRTLKERGIHDGYKMAERILKQDKNPDKIISSPAVRALHSATIFARVFDYPYHEIQINEKIYHAGTNQMLTIIKDIPKEIDSLMVFGHNPTFTDLANYFIGNEIENVPTTGIVDILFEINSWSDISNLKVKNWFFDYPKKIDEI